LSVVVFLNSCSDGGNSLKGTWETKEHNEYNPSIVFSGKNFTITDYVIHYWYYPGGPIGDLQSWKGGLSFNVIDYDNLAFIEEFDASVGEGKKDARYRSETKGTYSLSPGRIEMTFPNGSIEIYSFSQTENTINIGGIQLTRKK